jgi:hypothetical protein
VGRNTLDNHPDPLARSHPRDEGFQVVGDPVAVNITLSGPCGTDRSGYACGRRIPDVGRRHWVRRSHKQSRSGDHGDGEDRRATDE